MKALILEAPSTIESRPLIQGDLPIPEAGYGEILVHVSVCGICRTDLHITEGDLEQKKSPLVPGHQIVGTVKSVGVDVTRFSPGDRIGVTWLFSSCGECRYCKSDRENLCDNALFTGYDRDGGYAEYTVVPACYAYSLPEGFSDEQAAPLLCAGVIGYRSLRLSEIEPGGRLGLVGFGASAHVAIQIAHHWNCEPFVFTRSGRHREHALDLGAVWAGGVDDDPGTDMDSIIIFAPSGKVVPPSLAHLRKGGVLAINAVHMTPIPEIPYELIYHERTVRSVANCSRSDAEELLALAAEIPIHTDVDVFPFEEANEALLKMKRSELRGAAVLRIKG